MSKTYSYTFYLPSEPGKAAIFGIDFKNLPPPQSQVYQLMQATRQIQSTPLQRNRFRARHCKHDKNHYSRSTRSSKLLARRIVKF